MHADTIQLLARLTLGLFFVLARFRFFCDPSQPKGNRWLCDTRHKSLTNKMCYCGYKHMPIAWAWFTSLVEVGAGIGVILGLFSSLSALGLLCITIGATLCTFRDKVIVKQKPVDWIDIPACYLWTVEPLYIILAIIILIGGPGAYSVDALLWH